MIFNAESNTVQIPNVVSAYEFGLEGALMHVYENECAYNSIMKSVGLSELKYYRESGNSLFICEAEASGSFWDKVLAFIEKVKNAFAAIINKAIGVFGHFSMQQGEKFVKANKDAIDAVKDKKYDFPYEFGGVGDAVHNAESACKNLTNSFNTLYDEVLAEAKDVDTVVADAIGELVGGSWNSDNNIKDYMKEKCYGEKGAYQVTVGDVLQNITNTNSMIKSLRAIEKGFISSCDKARDLTKKQKNEDVKAANNKMVASTAKGTAKYVLDGIKEISNAYTIAIGIIINALSDRYKYSYAAVTKALKSGAKDKKTAAKDAKKDEKAAAKFKKAVDKAAKKIDKEDENMPSLSSHGFDESASIDDIFNSIIAY